MIAQPQVAIRDIAAWHGVRRQAVHRIVKRFKIEPIQLRSEEAKGQRVSYITQDEYDRIKATLDGLVEQDAAAQSGADSVFYLLLPEPSSDPSRFKVGFAVDVKERVRHFRTIAPFTKLVKTWPCKALWEKTAIDSVTHGCERIHTEVFRSDAIEEVVYRADKFFELMPKPSSE